jgi:hypothetical protein
MAILLEYGSWDKRPHYAVVGSNADFYVYFSERKGAKWSGWVKGRDATKYYEQFRKLRKEDNKEEFIKLMEEIFDKYPYSVSNFLKP